MKTKRLAFTLVELLVVIAIIGILVGMALPAVQGLRESSRRAMCVQNLTRISLGLADYNITYGAYPAGSVASESPVKSIPEGFHHNWISGLLPYLDHNAMYKAVDRSESIYADSNALPMATAVSIFRCPSATLLEPSVSCYAGVHHPAESPIAEDNLGVFILNQQLSDDDIVDGLASTLFVSEKLEDWTPGLGWLSGTRASLRNTGHPINQVPSIAGATGEEVDPLMVGGLQSAHATGVNALMGEGSIRYLANSIDMTFVQQLADRRDGAIASSGAPSP